MRVPDRGKSEMGQQHVTADPANIEPGNSPLSSGQPKIDLNTR